MATAWERIADNAYMSWLSERQIVSNEYNEASLVDRSALRAQFEHQQHQQRVHGFGLPPLSPVPTPRVNDSVCLPSDGLKKPKRPRTGEELAAPSNEDKLQPGDPTSAMKYVASEELYCSSNEIAMEVTRLLEVVKNQETIDQKYHDAANHVLSARQALNKNTLQEERVKQNERFFTGAFCEALSAVVDKGFSVLHRGCIGEKSTHSDLSARYILHRSKRPTLMVGKGKANASSKLRTDTRGQIFNQLIRHRKIDATLGFEEGFRPILLLAFDFDNVLLDLAFPSKKGGFMEKSGWLNFESTLEEGAETFWTTQIASVSYQQGKGKTILPKIIRFIADTLRYLHQLDAQVQPRLQFKTPFITPPLERPTQAEKRGDNVTILEFESGKRVYKEFCYYLRQDDGFNAWGENAVIDTNQRKPPSQELLQELGGWYSDWKLEQGPFDIKVLSYEFKEGRTWPSSRDSWKQVLEKVKVMHQLGYIHGDLLPRNLIFSDNDDGLVIDFDLTRKEGSHYTSGYNYEDFADYRHPDAQAGKEMRKVHDVHALTMMTGMFFEVDISHQQPGTIDELIKLFSDTTSNTKPDLNTDQPGDANDSPKEVDRGPGTKIRFDDKSLVDGSIS